MLWFSFPGLFSEIEREIKAKDGGRLGIDSYGASMTTLEEVFLRLGEEDEEDKQKNGSASNVRFYSI